MNSLHNVFHNKINFSLCSEAPDAESQRRMRHVLSRTLEETEQCQHG